MSKQIQPPQQQQQQQQQQQLPTLSTIIKPPTLNAPYQDVPRGVVALPHHAVQQDATVFRLPGYEAAPWPWRRQGGN